MKLYTAIFAAMIQLAATGIAQTTSTASQVTGSFTERARQAMSRPDQQPTSAITKGDADHDFAAMMVIHHRSGIRMAQMYLQEAKNEELKSMAEKMIEEQEKEARKLERIISEKRGTNMPAPSVAPNGPVERKAPAVVGSPEDEAERRDSKEKEEKKEQ